MVKRVAVDFMLEEIADSMTAGGLLAAVLGLCAALGILVLWIREQLAGGRQATGRTDPVNAVPSAESPECPIPDGPTLPGPDTVSQPVSEQSKTPETVQALPGSAFKPYVPPRKP
jgi:hypothetical protein